MNLKEIVSKIDAVTDTAGLNKLITDGVLIAHKITKTMQANGNMIEDGPVCPAYKVQSMADFDYFSSGKNFGVFMDKAIVIHVVAPLYAELKRISGAPELIKPICAHNDKLGVDYRYIGG